MYNDYALTIFGKRDMDMRTIPTVLAEKQPLYNGSITNFLKEILTEDRLVLNLYKSSISCRESVVNYLYSYYHRQKILMDSGYISMCRIACNGDYDRKAGAIYRGMSDENKILLKSILTTQLVTPEVYIKVDPDDRLTITFPYTLSMSPISVSMALLIIRLLPILNSIDEKGFYLQSKVTFAKMVLSSMDTILGEVNTTSYGIDSYNLSLAMAFLICPYHPTGSSFNFFSNGPSSYVQTRFFTEDWWVTVLRTLLGTDLKTAFNGFAGDIPELDKALIKLGLKGA
jgi:hypothetical protein